MGKVFFACFAALCILAPASAQTPFNPNSLSPAAYFSKPTYRALSLSPNGRYLAFLKDLDQEAYAAGVEQEEPVKKKKRRGQRVSFAPKPKGDELIILDLETYEAVRREGFKGHSIYTIHWATNDHLVLSISTSYDLRFGRSLTIELPAVRTFSLDWRTGDATVLFGENRAVQRENLTISHIVHPLPDDPDHLLMSAYRRGDLDLWKVNIISGESGRIATGRPNTFGWLVDGNGAPAFRLDANRAGTQMKAFARTSRGGWTKIASVAMNDKGETPEFTPIGRGERPNEIYVLVAPEDEETGSIKVFDLTTGAFTGTVFSSADFDVGGGVVDPATGEYLGGWFIDDRYQFQAIDPDLQRHIRGVNRFFEDDANVRPLAYSRDRSTLIFEVSSPRIPGEIYVYDYAAREINLLLSQRPKLNEDYLSHVEAITYEARDGVPIHGYVTHPLGVEKNKAAPLLVMPHGGPVARDFYDFDPMAQFFASRGYRVFQPNFRGSWGYGAEFRKSGYREWGGVMHRDLVDGIRHLQKKGLTRSKGICIIGASYGGYAALYATLENPEFFSCAVSIAGVTDLPDIIDYERTSNPESRDAYEAAMERIGDPRDDKAMLVEKSPARRAAEIKTPLLIIHGTKDSVVPFAQAKKLTNALDEAKVEYQSMWLVDGHSFENMASYTTSMRRIEEFLYNNINKPPPQ